MRKKIQSFQFALKIMYTASPKLFVLKLLFIGITTVFVYFPLLLWRELINEITSIGQGADAHFLVGKIAFLFLGYGILFIAEKMMMVISEIIEYRYNDEIDYFIDGMMIEKVSSAELVFFDSSQVADRASNSWMMIFAIKRVMENAFRVLQNIINLVGAIALLAFINVWIIPFALVLCIPLIRNEKRINEINYAIETESGANQRRKEYYKDLFFEESYSEISVYGLKDFLWKKYSYEWGKMEELFHKRDVKCCETSIGTVVASFFCDIVVFADILFRIVKKRMEVGDVLVYLTLVTQLRDSFIGTLKGYDKIEKDSVEINAVIEFMQYKPETIRSGNRKLTGQPVIEFCDVSFRYPNAEEYVIKNCSFKWKYGEKIGLVGLNGSGKSTLVKLLCRFYVPTEGRILLNGIDYEEYDLKEIRRLFGALFQDYVKYSLTLRDNIAISNIEMEKDEKRLREAADYSGIESFFIADEMSWDLELSKRFSSEGRELSGGQWQRVALARAFFRDAPFMILDEPSASLDPRAERDLFDKVEERSFEKGVLLISHNLSNVSNCGVIYVLEDGRVIEFGSHRELMGKKGKYFELFEMQAAQYLQV